jgi:hypothetical protein
MTDMWEFLERGTTTAPKTQEVYEWSLNYDPGKGPFSLLLDLIGWSEENLGQPCYRGGNLGWKEAVLLADSLTEWADNPHGVEEWITEMIRYEVGE